MRTMILLTIILYGCVSTSKTPVDTESDDYNDVILLTYLIQDQLKKINTLDLSLDQIIENDSLNRISKSFKGIDFNPRGGHISIHFKFSDSRKANGIELTDREKELTKYYYNRFTMKELKLDFDGEIRLDYGERFYRILRITLNSKTK